MSTTPITPQFGPAPTQDPDPTINQLQNFNAGSPAPSPEQAQPEQKGGLWRSVLHGALVGLTRGGIPGAILGAAQPHAVQQAEQNRQDAFDQQMADSKARMAHTAVETQILNRQYNMMPTDMQDAYDKESYRLGQDLEIKQGVTPVMTGLSHSGVTDFLKNAYSTTPAGQEYQAYSDGKNGYNVYRISNPDALNKSEMNVIVALHPGKNADGSVNWDSPTQETTTVPPGTMKIADILHSPISAAASYWKSYNENAGKSEQRKADTQAKITVANQTGVTAKNQAEAKAVSERGTMGSVYAFDPSSNQTVLTTPEDAAAKGMQGVRKVNQSQIASDTHNLSVLNDVSLKANQVAESAKALDQDQRQKDVISWALGENGIKIGFGEHLELPMDALVNNSLRARNMGQATDVTKDYIIAVLSLRESAMGMNRVLTGSARASESQIKALQATLPGYENSGADALRRLRSFGQNVDALRHPIPVIPGVPRIGISLPDEKLPTAGFTIPQPLK